MSELSARGTGRLVDTAVATRPVCMHRLDTEASGKKAEGTHWWASQAATRVSLGVPFLTATTPKAEALRVPWGLSADSLTLQRWEPSKTAIDPSLPSAPRAVGIQG